MNGFVRVLRDALRRVRTALASVWDALADERPVEPFFPPLGGDRPGVTHDFVSAACFHDRHTACEGACWYCAEPCACGCHAPAIGVPGYTVEVLSQTVPCRDGVAGALARVLRWTR